MAEVVLTSAGIELVAEAIARGLDRGQAPGSLELMSERGSGGTVLAVLALAHPAAITPGRGRIEFHSIQEEPDAPGGARTVWARFRNAEGAVLLECDVGLERSKAAIELDEIQIRPGDVVRIKSLVLTLRTAQG